MFQCVFYIVNRVDPAAESEDRRIRSDTFNSSAFVFRIQSKVTDKAAAAAAAVFLFRMPSSRQCAAFEHRHWGGGDESSKVERQCITTHARTRARAQKEFENNEAHDCTNKQNKDFEMPKTEDPSSVLSCHHYHYHFL